MHFKATRGDLISLDFTHRDASGNPVDITNRTITAGARLRTFYATFTVTKTNALLGQYNIMAIPSATALWPVAILDCQVKVDGGGINVKRSEKFRLEIEQEV